MKQPKSLIIWTIAIIITLVSAIYQRRTGPSYPVSGTIQLHGTLIKYKFLRSSDDALGALISLKMPGTSVKGMIFYKKYKSNDNWIQAEFTRTRDTLSYRLPPLPPAGKMMYQVILSDDSQTINLTKEDIILRYKGEVPATILIPHILLMFLAMLFSTRTGLEAIFRRTKTFVLAFYTTIFLVAGGLILGMLVQKYAFGSCWTGFPFGFDLTDNKTAIALITWIIALFILKKRPGNRTWPIIAMVVLFLVYMIPHSMLGSEIDYTKNKVTTEKSVTK